MFLLTCGAALALATTAAGASQPATVPLDLHAVFGVTAHSPKLPCFCFYVDAGPTTIPGLGLVTYQSLRVVVEASTGCAHLSFVHGIVMSVAGRGEIDYSISVDPACNGVPTGFVVTGGTDEFAGASGSGTFVPNNVRSGHWVDDHGNYVAFPADLPDDWRSETWTGSITVSGHTFDLTPPVISGANSKRVTAPKRANSVRVRFKVTANDAVDGPEYVSCTRLSGSLFRIGRTRVKCWAADTNWNTAYAHFTVAVRRRRLRRVVTVSRSLGPRRSSSPGY